MHHVVGDVEGLLAARAQRPLVGELARRGHDVLAETVDAALVERGLGDPPLAQPEGALAHEQPVAEHARHVLAALDGFDELAVTLLQDGAHEPRVTEEMCGGSGEAHPDDVSDLAAPAQERRQGIADALAQVPEQAIAFPGGGRELGPGRVRGRAARELAEKLLRALLPHRTQQTSLVEIDAVRMGDVRFGADVHDSPCSSLVTPRRKSESICS